MVKEQLNPLERQEYSSSNTSTNGICQRQRQWMGLQLTAQQQQQTNRIWSLDSLRSTNADQLERTQSSISCTENLSRSSQHADPDQNGQYNLHGLYDQTKWNPLTSPYGISSPTLEMVPSTWHYNSIQSYCRNQQYHGRLRISPPLPEEQLDDKSINLPESSKISGTKRRRSVCRPDNETLTKVRILAPGLGHSIYRRIQYPLESISTSIPEHTVELGQSMSSENCTGEAISRHNDNSLVAQRSLVSNDTISEHQFTFTALPIGDRSSITNSHLANDKQYPETRRLELICSKYQQSHLNANAQAVLINHRIQDNSTNNSYKPGQLLFLKWCIQKQISQQFFTSTDLINFLSHMHIHHSTIQLFS
ncbi:uncharacterized protein EV154DRAFT_178500 [Mucor mucedo]|uniref:uncharacterized protein n=1 Tax=Mucor mucedo TaxID=29922 RepID=UPI0022211078|nr:uncharacterized protein EV154DRAFT_178500 [Mucor mucedo]KAI7896937.1 hypothetical protein EV154DRAFT_178500 [Mucor mucedo]